MTAMNFLLRDIEGLRHNWGWFLALGVLLIVLGLLALGSAVMVTLATMVLFGWFLIVGGVFQIVHAFWARLWGGFFLQLLSGVLQLVVGGIMVAHPLEAGVTLTMLMAVFFFVGGVFRIIAALAFPFEGRGWLALSGVINIVLGVIILSEWPFSGLWVIGAFIGIDLLLYGWWLVTLALSVRRLPRTTV